MIATSWSPKVNSKESVFLAPNMTTLVFEILTLNFQVLQYVLNVFIEFCRSAAEFACIPVSSAYNSTINRA